MNMSNKVNYNDKPLIKDVIVNDKYDIKSKLEIIKYN